jgi:HK97 family phage portal protein
MLSFVEGPDMTQDRLPILTPDDALKNPHVFRAVNFLTDKLAMTPFEVNVRLSDGGLVVDRRHTSYKILRRKVSPTMLASEWKRAMGVHSILIGNGLSYINAARSVADSVVLLNPYSVIMIHLPEGVEGKVAPGEIIYKIHHGGQTLYAPQHRVFHVRGFTLNGLWGLPFLHYANRTISTSNVASHFAYRYFKKGANPAFAVYYPKALAPENEERWLEMVKEAVEGVNQSHTLFPLYNDAKIQPLTTDPDKAQALEGRIHSAREIANIFGLPATTLNVPEANSYNSLEILSEAELAAVDPWFARFEEEANEKLLTEQQRRSESHECIFDRSVVRRMERDKLVETTIREVDSGLASLDEGRIRLGRTSTGLPEGRRYRIPVNLMYIDDPRLTDGNPANDDEPLEEEEPNDLEVSANRLNSFQGAVLDLAIRSSKRVTEKYRRICKDQDKLTEFCATGWHAFNTKYHEQLKPLLSTLIELSGNDTLVKDTPVGQWVVSLNRQVGQIESQDELENTLAEQDKVIEELVTQTFALLEQPNA